MIPSQSLTSLKIIGDNPEQSGLSDAINLKPGRIIDAKVLDVKSENRVQLLLSEKNEPGKPLLAGQKVEVSTQRPLKPGMSLTLTVVATREGPVLKLVSSTILSSPDTDAALKILPGKQKASTLSESGIKPGQTVAAKVLEVTSQNRVQLLVGGQKLTVSSQLPLARGMNIPMKVIRSQDGIVLKPVSALSGPASTDPAGSGINSTRGPVIDPTMGSAIDSARGPVVNAGGLMASVPATLPDSNPFPGTESAFQSFSLAKIFQGLSELSQIREPILNDILMGLALKSDVRDDQFLPKIIENMGLGFEKKLAAGLENASDKKAVSHVIKQLAGQDLKAASLSLSTAESDPGKASVFKHIADALDSFAQLNVKSGDSGPNQDGARFLLPFPVWREDGFDFGQLMVDMGKAGTANTKKKMLSISFLLNMTALGPLRADFSILDKTIIGRFLLENQVTCDYLTSKISDLRQRLSGIGYQAGNIDCQVARPEQIAPASLMLSMKAPDNMQGLSIVV
ncbi:flagellar hook-length control protein FliK [Desulfobacter vibrioformis]|uniref:flagellar hook-length control protein FliK n=1 Tax=Desulfobacter vibrioformis TaxID=34031 RepID=UPI0005511D4C|nr:flagellar hook-length control protein FliK [Desulfobacter vibrioformis]